MGLSDDEVREITEAAFESNPLPMAVLDADTMRYIAVNQAALRLFDIAHEEFLKLSVHTIRRNRRRARDGAQFEVPEGELRRTLPSVVPWRYERRDGTLIDIEYARSQPFSFRGRSAYLLIGYDVSHRQAERDFLRANGALLDAVKVGGMGSFSLDVRTGEYRGSSLLADVLGIKGGDEDGYATAHAARARMSPDQRHVVDDFLRAIDEKRPFDATYSFNDADGVVRWFRSITRVVFDGHGTATHIVGVTSDITDARHMADELLALTYRDVETGLPNRAALFKERLPEETPTDGVVLVHITLVAASTPCTDEQKRKRAREVARVISGISPPLATISRYADQLFAVVLPRSVHANSAVRYAKKVLKALTYPLRVGADEFVVEPSVGVARTNRGSDIVTLSRRAEFAVTEARSNESHIAVYNERLGGLANRRATLEINLRHATAGLGLGVVYQPILSIESGRTVAVEALMRWNCPGIGGVSPLEFIPLAEGSDVIMKIGEWILRESCAQARRWIVAGHDLCIAVNVSARQLMSRKFLRLVCSVCEAAELDPSSLELEITESVMMHQQSAGLRNLEALRRAGVRIAVDDFGTGYSSLSYLRNLPIDTIKIDRSFVTCIDAGGFEADVTRSVIALAHRRGLRVTAEGVETREQLDALHAMECDSAQGYFLGRPMSPEDVIDATGLTRAGVDAWNMAP